MPALRLLREGLCDRVLVAGIPEGQYPNPGPIEVLRGDPVPLFAAADAALAKSGTTTLEAALADTPMVVAYKVHPLTYAMFQRVRTVKWISLVNLVAEREVVPELLQEHASAGELASRWGRCSSPTIPAPLAQREGLALVRERLGEAGATTQGGSAGRRAAGAGRLRVSPAVARAVAGPAVRRAGLLLAYHRGP